jgi:DNA-binding NarL/FixJ family response regulator
VTDVPWLRRRRRANVDPVTGETGPRPLLDSGLSRRERDVLALMAEGWTNDAIATQLDIGVRAVESVVASIFRKLDLRECPDVNRRVAAVRRYLGEIGTGR